MTVDDTWREQWERTLRWHARLRELYAGDRPGEGSDKAADEMHAFFQSCWHLKDWLNKSLGTSDVDDVAHRAGSALQMCQRIANGTKHGDPVGSKSRHTGADVSLVIGAPVLAAYKWRFDRDGVAVDALVLADEAVGEWRAFLTGRGLL